MSRTNKNPASDEEGSPDHDGQFFSGSDDEDVEPQSAWSMQVDEKDSDEEDLERLVLGNRAGFRENLFKYGAKSDDEDALQGLKLEDGSAVLDPGLGDIDDSVLFTFDTGSGVGGAQVVTAPAADVTTGVNAPAWFDSDDEKFTVSLAGVKQLRKLRETEADDLVSGAEYTRRLRQQFLRLNPLPAWAREAEKQESKRRRRSSASSVSSVDSEAASEDDGDVNAQPLEKFLRNASLINGKDSRKNRKLRPEVIDIQRSRDIPVTHKGPVESLCFHPQHPVLLSSSTSSLLYLHHISPTAHPTPNPQLTSVQVKGVPVRRSAFLDPNGEEIIFAGRRRFFHSWNLSTGLVKKVTKIQGHQEEQRTMERFRLSPDGKHMALIATSRKGGGMLNIISVNSMQWIAQARIDSRGGIADFSWWRNGDGITILGRDGQVAEWSMATKRTVGIWKDEGSIGGTVMAFGGRGGPEAIGGDRWVALGSNSGVLNIYDRNDLTLSTSDEGTNIKSLPTPARSCEQITTPITVVTFTPDGQLLAFGSKHKKDALKLVHLPSCTIYRNWPTEQTPLGRITSVAFSRTSDALVVGNDMGKIRMWEIRK